VRRITGAGSPAQVLAVHDYYPFGLEATASCQDSERMKFTGHERDTLGTCSQTDDLDYMHARFYNPTVGRFLSPDPLRGNPAQPLSWNLYAYVLNNPLNFFDPLGLEPARPTKLADEEITVIGSDPCPGVPAGITCELWESVQRDLQRFFWESALRRNQPPEPPMVLRRPEEILAQSGAYQPDPMLEVLQEVASRTEPWVDYFQTMMDAELFILGLEPGKHAAVAGKEGAVRAGRWLLWESPLLGIKSPIFGFRRGLSTGSGAFRIGWGKNWQKRRWAFRIAGHIVDRLKGTEGAHIDLWYGPKLP
jgi:RHS repeat-associated protein